MINAYRTCLSFFVSNLFLEKIILLFLLFSFDFLPLVFFAAFWSFYSIDQKDKRIFFLILLGLLRSAGIIDSNIVDMCFVGLLFSYPSKAFVQDYALKSFMISFLLGEIDQANFTGTVSCIMAAKVVFIFIKMMNQKDMIAYFRDVFCSIILISFILEQFTDIGILKGSILAVILLKIFLEEVIVRYFFLPKRDAEGRVALKKILDSKNFTILFALSFLFVVLVPIFNNFILHLSMPFATKFYIPAVFLFMLFILSIIIKSIFYIKDVSSEKSQSSDLSQFFILSSPLLFPALFFPNGIILSGNEQDFKDNYLIMFFLLSFFYVISLVVIIHFKDSVQKWFPPGNKKIVLSMDSLLRILEDLWDKLFYYTASFMYLIQKIMARVMEELLNNKYIRMKGQYNIDQSFFMASLFLVSLLLVIYYGHYV